MSSALVEHELTLWMEADVPVRMVFAGERWTVTHPMPRSTRNAA
ncbi:hypothetical protein [Microbacterium lacticum]|nr:hypothetical protein [Microbacterium lacticum]